MVWNVQQVYLPVRIAEMEKYCQFFRYVRGQG